MYKNWNKNGMHTISIMRWYSEDYLIAYLHEARDFVTTTELLFSSTFAPHLRKMHDGKIVLFEKEFDESVIQIPASLDNRFPSNRRFLCEAIGSWSNQLDRLVLAISVLCKPAKLERQYPNFRTLGEAEEHVLDLIDGLIQRIAKGVGMIDRQFFEQHFGLNWESSEELYIDSNQVSNNKGKEKEHANSTEESNHNKE